MHAFWSLKVYNEKGFFVDNPINRYAVRGESLQRNPDGSVDIAIRRRSPDGGRQTNWLPVPAAGDFNLMLRLYWPDISILDGSWNPPAVTRVG